jgi:hypothetical protein
MTQCTVTVAAYGRLPAALADWESLEAAAGADEIGLVDGALVESDADTIQAFHRYARRGRARGSVAGAVLGLLRPPAIVTGAVAGGVGGSTIVLLGRTLARDEVKELGDVLDLSTIAIVAIVTKPAPPRWMIALGQATAYATVTMAASVEDLERAVDADEAEG